MLLSPLRGAGQGTLAVPRSKRLGETVPAPAIAESEQQ